MLVFFSEQLDLPFVKSFRCKEIRVTPLMNRSWNDNDDHSPGTINLAVGGQSCEKISTRSESRNSSEESEINREKQNCDSNADSAGEEETSEEVQKTRQSSQDINHQGNETVKVSKCSPLLQLYISTCTASILDASRNYTPKCFLVSVDEIFIWVQVESGCFQWHSSLRLLIDEKLLFPSALIIFSIYLSNANGP